MMDEQQVERKSRGAKKKLGAGPSTRGPKPTLPISPALLTEMSGVATAVGVPLKRVAGILGNHVEKALAGKVSKLYLDEVAAALGNPTA